MRELKHLKEIDIFLEILKQDEKINLSIFLNNLKTLKVYYINNENENDMSISKWMDAGYNARKNELYFTSISIKIGSIYHELLHCASSERKNNTEYCGFMINYLDINGEIGRGLNEGYTELLSERYFNVSTNYWFERVLTTQLEKIVGADFLKENYFNHNLQAIRDKLAEYSSKEAANDFIYNWDTYTIGKTFNDSITTEEYQSCLDKCCFFLNSCYENKLKTENNEDINKSINFLNEFVNAGTIELDGHKTLSLIRGFVQQGIIVMQNNGKHI